jgi:DNA-binding transcriptional regulator YiaG
VIDLWLDRYAIPEPNSGCYLWTKYVGRWGYGAVKRNGSVQLAHRVAWELRHGPPPQDMFVCHKCDVPSCVNPDHLFLGTALDNAADRNSKGRQSRGDRHSAAAKTGIVRSTNRQTKASARRGEANPNAILTAGQVKAIRADTRSQRVIAQHYGIGQQQVQRIKARRRWGHI